MSVYDDAGNRHTIIEYTDFIYAGTLQEPEKWVPGLKSYRLPSGGPCNLDDDGTFQVVTTGVKLRAKKSP